MTLELSLDEQQTSIQSAVARFCAQRLAPQRADGAPQEFSKDLWRELGELGVLALDPRGGEALNLVVAVEELGCAAFPGPIAAAQFALAVLPQQAEALASGELIVSLGEPPLMPWAGVANLFLGLQEGRLRRLNATTIQPVDTMAHEPWGTGEFEFVEELDDLSRGLEAYDLTVAAYLVGAGYAVQEIATAHARERRQFGQPIGSFQAVSFPLAHVWCDLTAAREATRLAAYKLDAGAEEGSVLTAAARLLAGRAARRAAFTAHQTLGAAGTTEGGPLLRYTRNIQQCSLAPPGERRSMDRLDPDVVSMLDPLPAT